MVTAKSKPGLPKRKSKPEIPLVEFEFGDYDKPFVMPTANRAPLKIEVELNKSNLEPLFDYAGPVAAVLQDMWSEEFQDFLRAWRKASDLDPKGSTSSSASSDDTGSQSSTT